MAPCWFIVVNNEETPGSIKAVNFSPSWVAITVAQD
jgi:hypothetical protein